MSLKFLKEGLSPQERAKITKTFNKQVKEEVKIQLAAIVETKLNGLVKGLRKKYTDGINEGVRFAKRTTSKQVKGLDEAVSKYITHLVAESLPGELVEKAGQGLRYGKFLDSILEAQKQELREEAEGELKKRIAKLEESATKSDTKYKQLFERMVNDANDKVIQTKKMKIDELLKEYPDKYADPMRKVIKETIDYASVETKDLTAKVERIFEAVKKTDKAPTPINEGNRTPTDSNRSRGRRPVRLPESAPADSDVGYTLDFMDNTTFDR